MPSSLHYVEDVLDPRGWRPVDVMVWAEMFEDFAIRRVGQTTIYRFGVHVWISTMFLGLDHQWGEGPPLLYETMVFGGPDHDDYLERETSRSDAAWTHEIAVQQQRDLSWKVWAGWLVARAVKAVMQGWTDHNRAMGFLPREPEVYALARKLDGITWWWQVTDRWPRVGMEVER